MKIVAIGARAPFGEFLKLLRQKSAFQISAVFISEYCRIQESAGLQALGFPVMSEVVGSAEFVKKLRVLAPDLLVVYGATEILKKEVLDIPLRGAINLHSALLPFQRGAGGDYGAFVNDKVHGISVHFVDEGIDSGDVIVSQSWPIAPNDLRKDVDERASAAAPVLLVQGVELALSPNCPRTPQKEYCFYGRKPPWDEFIDWRESAQMIYDKIRARNPGPLNFTLYKEQVLFVFSAELFPEVKSYHAPVGQVLGSVKGKGTIVKAGDGAILLTKVAYANSQMTLNRSRYPYDIPQEVFIPQFAISTVLGLNPYREIFLLKEQLKRLQEEIRELGERG